LLWFRDSTRPEALPMDARLQARPTALELFTPKLVTVFREGYGSPTCAPTRSPG